MGRWLVRLHQHHKYVWFQRIYKSGTVYVFTVKIFLFHQSKMSGSLPRLIEWKRSELEEEHTLNTRYVSCPAVAAQRRNTGCANHASALLRSVCLPGETLPLRQGFYTFPQRCKEVDHIQSTDPTIQGFVLGSKKKQMNKTFLVSVLFPFFLVTVFWILRWFRLLRYKYSLKAKLYGKYWWCDVKCEMGRLQRLLGVVV